MNVPQKAAFTVPEACAFLGIGRTNLYKIAGEGKLDLRKVGGRTLITAESLKQVLEEAPRVVLPSREGK